MVKGWQVLQGGVVSVAAVLWKGSISGTGPLSAGTGRASLSSSQGGRLLRLSLANEQGCRQCLPIRICALADGGREERASHGEFKG